MEKLDRDVEVQADPDDNEAESEIQDNIDRKQQESVDRHPTHPDPKPSEFFTKVLSRVYKPKSLFTPTQMKAKRELEKAICKKALDKTTVEMPLRDAVQISSPIKKYVKDMVTRGFQPSEDSVLMVSKQVSAMIQERIPIK